jgi:hypothetical protein
VGLCGCFWDGECGEFTGFTCYVNALRKTNLAPFLLKNMKERIAMMSMQAITYEDQLKTRAELPYHVTRWDSSARPEGFSEVSP